METCYLIVEVRPYLSYQSANINYYPLNATLA